MDKVNGKLTVFFEESFWVGIFERIEDGKLSVAKVTFGAKPKDQWLDENAYKYGFVKHYPEDKTDITGISNEPWHYRYVGTTVAKIMKEENLCLEEYLEKYK